MTKRLTGILAVAVLCVSCELSEADQYQISGTVVDQSTNPVVAEVDVVVTSSAVTSRSTTVSSSNGTYSVALSGSSGNLATVAAERPAGYHWVRDITLGSNTNIQALNFVVSAVDTTKVSVAGVISVQGRAPSESATIGLKKADLANGQTLTVARLVSLGGFSATNSYQIFDLPPGSYSVSAQADASAWTQIVISGTWSNTSLRLDVNF